MRKFTDKEKTLLAGFNHGVLGGPDDDCRLDQEQYRDALEALKASGLIHKVWVLSPKGVKAADRAAVEWKKRK